MSTGVRFKRIRYPAAFSETESGAATVCRPPASKYRRSAGARARTGSRQRAAGCRATGKAPQRNRAATADTGPDVVNARRPAVLHEQSIGTHHVADVAKIKTALQATSMHWPAAAAGKLACPPGQHHVRTLVRIGMLESACDNAIELLSASGKKDCRFCLPLREAVRPARIERRRFVDGWPVWGN